MRVSLIQLFKPQNSTVKPHQWKCQDTSCGNILSGHTKKTIKVDRMFCGSCKRGQLEYLGSINADGTPHKKKPASGFSLFVKDNFASVKKSLESTTSHKEIMAELSRLYKLK